MTAQPRRRVLLKLSGEAFGGGSLGVNPDVVQGIARQIAEAAESVEIAIVVGGGNFFRGAELSQRGMERGRADYMGMLGTVMNALALQDFLEQAGAQVRVQSAISMTQVAEPGAKRWMGGGLVRKEDPKLITGQGRYTDDIALPGMLSLAFVLYLAYQIGFVDGLFTSLAK